MKRGEGMKRLMKPNGLKLHLLRTSRELNMSTVAEQSKLCRRSIYQIEKGEMVTPLTAQKISNAYNIDVFNYFELIEK
jgi:transcriptional regulator with XRE-family HTH domain